MTAARGMAADAGPSYAALLSRVEDGSLRLCFVLGLARGGTTAIEKAIYEALPFDVQINEPSLLGPPTETSRMEATFSGVLAHVEQCESRLAASGSANHVHALVKEVTNKVLPEMVPLWAKLSRCVLIVVRNPSLQIESRLKSMLDRVDSGALDQFGVQKDMPVEGKVHGRPVFVGDSKGETWQKRYSAMMRHRNFSGLGQGAVRICTLHPFCAWKECQDVIWGASFEKAVPLEAFEFLTEAQCDAILRWRLGWFALQLQLQALDECCSKAPETPQTAIADFSSFQMDAGKAALDFVSEAMNFEQGRQRLATRDFETCSQQSRWSPEDWHKWYAAPCFIKACASNAIEPVTKAPLALRNFPKFLRGEVESACALWAALLVLDGRALQPPGISARAPFVGLDPLHDTVCDLQEASQVWWRSGPTADRVSRRASAALHALGSVGGASSGILDLGAALFVLAAQSLMLFQCAVAYAFDRCCRAASTIEESGIGTGEQARSHEGAVALSVVIIAHNEAVSIGRTLRAVVDRATTRVEVVIVDGGSTDGTLEIVEAFATDAQNSTNASFVVCPNVPRGRGPALNAGVAASAGALVLMLHADTVPPEGYDAEIANAFLDATTTLAAFSFSTAATVPRRNKSLSMQIFEKLVNLRSSCLEFPLGDQGLACRRTTLLHGILKPGFADIPILEDVELVLRCRRFAKTKIVTLAAAAVTSARRYEKLGLTRSSLENAAILLWWHVGATPSQIFRLYYGKDFLRR
ncbi:hypothetical protein M885DRAFT_611752 [Pelagophyceae sp. CCMP2097]|nr:hypothetical protein M885DRAFT_611752 [Pelagophyceae sp. CCMP2097]